jgi:hypothetical protein
MPNGVFSWGQKKGQSLAIDTFRTILRCDRQLRWRALGSAPSSSFGSFGVFLAVLGCAAPNLPHDLRLCVGRGARSRCRLLDSLRWRFVGLLASGRDQDNAEQDNESGQSNTRPDPQSIGRANRNAARALLRRRRRLRGTFTNGHAAYSLMRMMISYRTPV